MILKTTITSILLFLFISCRQTNDLGKLYSLEKIQDNNLEQFYKGETYLSEMKEIIENQKTTTNPEFKNNLNLLFKSLVKIDLVSGVHISTLSNMKNDLFNSLGEKMNIKDKNSIINQAYKYEKPSQPLMYHLNKVKITGQSNLLSENNRNTIIESIKRYRSDLCKIIVESLNTEKNKSPFLFIDPQINEFKDINDFDQQYDRKIKMSNISLDDAETVKEIYRMLSKNQNDWEKIIDVKESWIDDLSILLSIENDILKARTMAFSLIRGRIGS